MNDPDNREGTHLGCNFCKLSGTFMVRLYVQEYPYHVDEEGVPNPWKEGQLSPKETHPSTWKSYLNDDSTFFCSLWCHSEWNDLGNHVYEEECVDEKNWYVALYKERVLCVEPPKSSLWDTDEEQ